MAIDLSGNDVILGNLYTGATTPGSAGTISTAAAQTFTGVKTLS